MATKALRKSSIGSLLDEVARRINGPRNQTSFLSYFFGVVVGLGGFGVWAAAFRALMSQTPDYSIILGALYTYFPAITCAAIFDLILSGDTPKPLRSFALLSGIFLGALAMLAALLPLGMIPWFMAIIGVLGAFLLWWISNAENPNLMDEPLTEAPIGGNPEQELSGAFGDVKT